MNTEALAAVPRVRGWPRRVAITIVALGAIAIVSFKVAQRMSDGPLTDIIPGGALRSGQLVTEPVEDWTFADGKTVELQLESPRRSRYTGLITYNDELYVPCDLGYMWGRFSGGIRHTLHAIYLLKTWHEDALLDGRVVFRLEGKRYERQAVRVTDPQLVNNLKTHLENLAREWVAPDTLGPPPTEGPRDIWFFRLDPRTTSAYR